MAQSIFDTTVALKIEYCLKFFFVCSWFVLVCKKYKLLLPAMMGFENTIEAAKFI